MESKIKPLDLDRLREEFRSAEPFPHMVIEEFLDPEFAARVVAEYPSYEDALQHGREFDFVNERRKVQITDSSVFGPNTRLLHEALASPEFLQDLSYVTGIPDLLADPGLAGGGIHETADSGRLDVHVDFNFVAEKSWHRRLNILLYLNPEWRSEWGGEVELWDREIRRCYRRLEPTMNRCLVFQTSEISYHGVCPVTSPPGTARKSFAAYYYTMAAPENWDGRTHSTVFRARPEERFRGWVLMPLERLRRRMGLTARSARRAVRKIVRPE